MELANKHKLASAWVYWEKRKQDEKQNLKDWNTLLLPLFEFDTIEDFGLFWKRAPRLPDVFDQPKRGPANLVRRKDERAGATGDLTTKAEGYAVFRKGIFPDTGAKKEDGTRHCQGRKRAELAVRVDEFEAWQKAWETTVLAVIGEQADPANFLIGAYLNDKNGKGSVSLRMELWFSTNDEEIMNAIAEEVTYHLKTALPDKRFNFVTPPYEINKARKAGDKGGDRGGDRPERSGGGGGGGGGGEGGGRFGGGGGEGGGRYGGEERGGSGGFRGFDGGAPRGSWGGRR